MKKQIILAIFVFAILAGLIGIGIFNMTKQVEKESFISEEKQLTNLYTEEGIYVYDFSWSPDGKKIAFVAQSMEGTFNIWTVDRSGSNQKQLTNLGGYNTNPRWSPDGKKLMFVSTKDNNTNVWIMNDDGINPKQLTLDEPNSWDSSWSPDGKKIVYILHKFFKHEVWIPSPYEIWIMNDNGTEQKQLTSDVKGKRNPLFSPDGNKIIFIATVVEMSNPEMSDVQEELWIMNADGTNPKVIIKTDEAAESVIKATWALNSKEIFVEFYGNNKRGFLVIGTEGNNEKKIITLGENMRHFALSPNGKKIAFAQGKEIWTMNSDGTNQKILTESLEISDNISWSPDGKKIAFTRKGEIWTLTLK